MKTERKRASTIVSALTARTQLGQILMRVKTRNERFIIGRRGQPQAVVMSIEDYIDTVAPAPEWLKSSWADAVKNGTDKLTMQEINTIIAEERTKVTQEEQKASCETYHFGHKRSGICPALCERRESLVLRLALTGWFAASELCRTEILNEYREVLERPRLKISRSRIQWLVLTT